ncbi:MAG: DUF6382 domain-containing protein [Eubacterium sp.]|nr:DUF6382 domain-containing protein [Eubacterium sp.]
MEEIVREGQVDYLKIDGGSEEDGFWEGLVQRKKIPGVLPMEIRRVDGEKEYWFCLTGRICLWDYLEEEGVTQTLIWDLFGQLDRLLGDINAFLLEETWLCLRPEIVFFNRLEGRWEFVLRKGQEEEVARGLQRLVECFLEKIDPRDQTLSALLYQLHARTMEARVRPGDLLLMDQVRETKKEEKKARDSFPTPPKPKLASYVPESQGPAWLPLLVVVAGLFSFFFLWKQGIFIDAVTGDLKMTHLALVLVFIFLVSGVGVAKLLPKKEKSQIIYREEDEEKKIFVCLVPRQTGGSLIYCREFPHCLWDKLKLERDGPYVYIINQEAPEEVFKNNRLLIPWQRERLEDGDELSRAGESYVVELS